jgi:metal-responsive CopG/Arc/MetJ family transcriptional regulator
MLQKVTISLPDELIADAKHLAHDRGMSLSRFIATMIEEHIEHRQTYEQAKARQMKLMAEGIDMGTEGKITWTRDELHDRGALRHQ